MMVMETPDPTYSYRPSLVGALHAFQLRPEGIGFEVGSRSGTVPYGAIRRVRMSYRPVSLQPHRFVTEVWADGAPKLQIASATARGMAEIARQDAAYSDFVTALHRRLGAAGTAAVFESGKNPVVYWVGLVLIVAVGLGLVALAVGGLQAGSFGGAALVVGFLALFVWQMGNLFRRNRPRRYTPDAPPADLLPR